MGRQDFAYYAFISYSRKNVKAASYFHHQLEHFRIPIKYVAEENRPPRQKFLRPVFRDRRDLEASENSFTEDIKKALAQTRYLIVLCSPEAASSKWVEEEIRYFLQTHDHDYESVVPVVLSGNPGGGEMECLPAPLRIKSITARNLPSMVPEENEDEKAGWLNGVVQAMSYMLKVKREKIRASVDAERVRQAKIYSAIGLAGSLVFAALSFWAVKAERLAESNRRIAERNQLRAEENWRIAEKNRQIAHENEKRARTNEEEARRQRDKAEANRVKAEENEKRARTNEEEARRQRDKAEANRVKAEENEKRAWASERLAQEKKALSDKTLDFVKKMLQEGKPDEHGPKNVVDLLTDQLSKIELLEPEELRISVAMIVGQIMQEQTLVRPAERLLKMASDYYREKANWPAFAQAANSLSVIYSTSGREQASLSILEEVRERTKDLPANAGERAVHFHNTAVAYFNLRNLEQAKKYCRQAKEALGNGGGVFGAYVKALEADISETQGDRKKAMKEIEEAIAIHVRATGKNDPVFKEKHARLALADGAYDKAREIAEDAKRETEKTHGKNHALLVRLNNILGLVYMEKGSHQAALLHFEEAIAVNERLGLPKANSIIGTTYNNLGNLYYRLKNPVRAKRCFRNALEIGERLFGESSPENFLPLCNMGFHAMENGEYKEARKFLDRAVGITVKAYGPDHPNLMSAYANLSSVAVNTDAFVDALSYANEVARLCKLHGKEETEMMQIALCNLALANWRLGKREEAMAQIEKSVAIAKTCFRPTAPERRKVMAIYERMTNGGKDAGKKRVSPADDLEALKSLAKKAIDDPARREEAEKLYGKFLLLLKERGEEFSGNYALGLNQLGVLAAWRKDYAKAVAYYSRAIEIEERIHGSGSPNLTINYKNMGSTLNNVGDTPGAIKYYRKALAANRSAEEPDEALDSDVYTELARLYDKSNDYTNAVSMAEKALACDNRLYRTNSAILAVTQKDLGEIHLHGGAYGLAITNLLAAQRLYECAKDPPLEKLALVINQLGIAYYRDGNLEGARACHYRVYEIDKTVYGVTNRETAVAAGNIAHTEQECGNYRTAAEWYKKSVALKIASGRFTDDEVALDCYGQGTVLYRLERHEEAMASYREALKRWLRTHGREHRDVMQTYEEMANVSKAQKNHEDEKVYRRKSLDVALALYKETSEEVLKRYNAMAACLTAGGRYENAAKIRRKILDIKTKTTSRNDAARAKAHAEYAIAQFHCAQYDSAYTNNLEALAIYERSGEPFRSSVAVVLSNLADTAKRMGAYDEAVRRYEASLKLVETHKIALDTLPFLKNLPREIEACKKLKASCAVVKMTEVFRNQAADKAGALADDVWISIGPWHAKDALGKRRDRFWSSACESWESLTNTHRVLFLARKVDGKWKKIPCAFEKEHGGFRYGIDAMPKDEFGRMLEQTR